MTEANGPDLWRASLPWPAPDTHKYARGHLAVFTGGALASGAGRLAARAGVRAGAGAVTALCPGSAALVLATHLSAIMLRKVESREELLAFHEKARTRAYVLGPGFGQMERAREFADTILTEMGGTPLVLDADGITAFRDDPAELFDAASSGETRLVLTPHEGEFARLFPDLADNPSRTERAASAAKRSGGVVVLKGPETVIAAPDGRLAVNRNGTPFLATAGSGDVLAAITGGLLAQGMPIFEAACAAVWMHAEAAARSGPGLTADDLPDALLPVLRELAPASHQPRVR